MNGWLLASGSSLWLGVMTSISPCPLATNIAAVSFVARRVQHPRAVLLSGLLYTLGRALTYSVLAALLVGSLLSAPVLSHFLQKHMHRVLGPVLVLTGMVLLGLLDLPVRGPGFLERARGHAARQGAAGSLLLGMLFALSFCPVSAALFFGSLLPLAIQQESRVFLPSLFGAGTALPVLVFAVAMALGLRSVAQLFDRVGRLEQIMRWITGGVFLLVGLYMIAAYVFRVI